ncbi:helix-turn-helix domain-containing protein [Sinirhodobacter sp. WL0062]|uniref:Helix-turn-helix domain-containing protein n=1 Tax=Rhodobacter flavimaris TaxID=2907145 RepID=A0ABS8Z1J8_9RHOB|nr:MULTISPECIES: helix-turn-helix domain-containing protein [Paracoccaceae]MCE5974931.1 helix-turn-helix domain-containing protein [Sinirhodobacter sp. WL0062]MCT2541227.1 helix-turn-helix domain-containing protein [Sedimentimonas flavescens]WBL33081.1 helix-turn-helix domain-containing protein [Sinirhodobacter sp. HNIBRBA609]
MQHQTAAQTRPTPTSQYWDGFITETDAADYLCQSVRTLQKWRVTGFGPQFYKPGRSVRYRRRDLREWAEARRHANTSQYTS